MCGSKMRPFAKTHAFTVIWSLVPFDSRVSLSHFPTHNNLSCAPVHSNHRLITIKDIFRFLCELQITDYFFQQCKVLFVQSNISHPGSFMTNIVRFSISEVIPFLEVVLPLISRPCFIIKSVRLLAFFNNTQSKCFHSGYG